MFQYATPLIVQLIERSNINPHIISDYIVVALGLTIIFAYITANGHANKYARNILRDISNISNHMDEV
jgi:hypothetical protein